MMLRLVFPPMISLTQQSQAEIPQLDSDLVVPTFQQGEDLIDCINKAMAFQSTFQTEDLDTYDSDCDDISSAKAVLMANLSSYDSDVLSKVPYSDTYLNDVINQEIWVFKIRILLHQMTLVLSLVEQMTDHVANLDKENQTNKMVNESLTAELERYKERVAIFEQRLNVDLKKHEKLIDSQMDDLIRNRNSKFVAFQQEIDTFKETLSSQVKEKESLSTTLTVFKIEWFLNMERGFLSSSKKDNTNEVGGKEQSSPVGITKQVKNIEGKMIGRDGGYPLATMEGENMHDSDPAVNMVCEEDNNSTSVDNTSTNAMENPSNVPISFVDALNAAVKPGKSKYDNTLVGYFLGKNIAFPLVRNYVNNTWGKFGLQNLMKTDDGVFLFKFSTKEGLEQVLQKGPWMIRHSPILLSKWSPTLSLKKGEVNKVPVWVKLFNVPVLAYSGDGLSLIATQIGKPIMLDAFTSSMCVDSWGRISFARALIEVCADSVLKKEVIMAIENEEDDGYTREVIRVEYEWKPPHCVECKCFGHDPNTCPKRVKENAPKAPPTASTTRSAIDNEDGFTTVSSQKKKKKSGPNRVSGINLSKCNPNLKYRPVSQPGKGKGDDSKEANGPKKGSTKDNGNGKLVHIDEVVPTQNSFANLREEESELDEDQNVSYPVNADGKDKEKKDDTTVVNEEEKSQTQGSLWEKFKASKEASSSKFTSLDDDESDDDEEVYMPNGIHGGGFMDGL
ncbi:reverse transcriptase domain-containing protein [Tanacetum coccineum]